MHLRLVQPFFCPSWSMACHTSLLLVSLMWTNLPALIDQSTPTNVGCVSSGAAARGRKVINGAYFLGSGGRSSKVLCGVAPLTQTMLERRQGSRYLQIITCADGIGPRQVGICNTRDGGQERMRKPPYKGCFVLHQSTHCICLSAWPTL